MWTLLLLPCFCFPFIHKLKHPYMTRVRYPILGMPNVILLNHINIQMCSNHRKGNDCRHKSMIKLRFPIQYIPQLDYAISFAQIHELRLDRTSMKQGNLMVHTSVLHYSQTLQLETVQWKLEIEAVLLANGIYLPHALNIK